MSSNNIVCATANICLCCLHTQTQAYREAGPSAYAHPLHLECILGAGNHYTRCHHCTVSEQICEPAVSAVIGDATDLMRILSWCHRFWEYAEVDDDVNDPDDTGIYSAEALQEIAELLLNLVESFIIAEKKTRKNHSLSRAEETTQANKRAYMTFVAQRRQLLASQFPCPGQYGTKEQWDYWNSSQLLRLLPGDQAFPAWNIAKQKFFFNVREQVWNDTRTKIGRREIYNARSILKDFPIDI